MSQRDCDLLVIGGGVIGLGAALHLRDLDPLLRIVVLDAPTRPGVASRAAAGMLAPYAEFEEDGALFRLCRASLDYYPEFLRRHAPRGVSLRETGILVPASGDSASRAARIGRFAERHVTVEEWSPARIAAQEPALDGGRCRSALRLPGAIINPRELHDALRSTASDRGIILRETRAVTAQREGNRLLSVTCDDGRTISPAAVLLASGAWSAALGELFGITLPMIPVKGQVARIAAPDGFLRHIVHEHEIYIAPREGHGIVIGATSECVGFDDSVYTRDIEQLHGEAVTLIPKLAGMPVAESWSGFRPRLPNGEPLIGRSDRIENLLLATGHYRNGILLTPITGRLIAEAWSRRSSTQPSFLSP